MDKDAIFSILKKNVVEVVPEIPESKILIDESLKKLGANSIDRAEIIMLTLEELQIKASMVEFSKANNISELCDIFLDKSSG